MNRFISNKSLFFFAVSWLFIIALFADGANLDDLLPGTVVIHSDEDNDSQTDSDLLAQVSDNAPVHAQSLPQHQTKQEVPQPVPPLRIVYDQDSDSLAANPVLASEAFVLLPPETQVSIESIIPTHSLYLRNCTFLI
ncbi:MAG TPA: hypothetical protein VMF88_00745 [Bacteroidota bacterium]|nr:hypothetical protein [Bacteroidota bacterium]